MPKCSFCREEMKEYFISGEHYETYHECNCEDTKKYKELKSALYPLKRKAEENLRVWELEDDIRVTEHKLKNLKDELARLKKEQK